MKLNEQRLRIKALSKAVNEANANLPPRNSHLLPSNKISKNNIFSSQQLQRSNTSSRIDSMANNLVSRNSLTQKSALDKGMPGSAMHKLGQGSTHDLDPYLLQQHQHDQAPFVVLENPDQMDKYLSNARKMVGSVSSKYLDYNSEARSQTGRINGQKLKGSRISGGQSNAGDSMNHDGKVNNYNEYLHVFVDPASNDANVTWITKLRDYDNQSMMSMNRINSSGVDDKVSHYSQSVAPSVYYRQKAEDYHKKIPDFEYKGNHLDVAHLTTKRIGPTAHSSQIAFETGLRKYASQKNMDTDMDDYSPSGKGDIQSQKSLKNQAVNKKRDFVTIFPKPGKYNHDTFGYPAFLPPITNHGKDQIEKLETIQEVQPSRSTKFDKNNRLISGYDSLHKSLPRYTNKPPTVNDYNQVRHLLSGSNVNMSSVIWECNLRSDAYVKRNEKAKDGSKSPRKNKL